MLGLITSNYKITGFFPLYTLAFLCYQCVSVSLCSFCYFLSSLYLTCLLLCYHHQNSLCTNLEKNNKNLLKTFDYLDPGHAFCMYMWKQCHRQMCGKAFCTFQLCIMSNDTSGLPGHWKSPGSSGRLDNVFGICPLCQR